MKIEYIKGDLIASSESVIAHGCNAQGVMKSGIAKAIRAQYPQAYKDYKLTEKVLGDLDLGSVIYTHTGNRVILNIITQQYYGRDNIRYVSYDAIANAIENINTRLYKRVAFPLIGAGLANGNWKVISSIIEAYSNFNPVVYYLDQSEEFVRSASA